MADLLFLTQRIPYPPDKGDKIRSWRILESLTRRYDVHLGCFYDDHDDARHIPFLQGMTASLCCRPLNRLMARLRGLASLARGAPLTLGYFADARLKNWVNETLAARQPSHVFVFCSAMAPYVADYRAAVSVLDMVDVDSDKWRQYAESKPWPMRALYAREHRTLQAFERESAMQFDATLLASSAEAKLFRTIAPEAAERILAMGNGTDIDYFSPERRYGNPFAGAAPTLVFVGAMDYWPNIDAATWFAREVMPLVRRRRPEIQFCVVGANPTQAVRRLAEDQAITVTGRVPDVRPYLHHAAAVVAPLHIVRGVLNKLLEAMAMAKPVIATPEACDGLALAHGDGVLIARTEEDFAREIDAVLGGATPQLGAQARALVLARHQWNLSVLDRILEGGHAVAHAG